MVRRNNTFIRKYTEADIEQLLEMGVREIPKLPNYANVNVDRDRLKFLLTNNVRDESGFMVRILIAPDGSIVGGIAAYCVTQILSWDKSTGDIFLFIDPKWRSLQNAVDLITSYVIWAKERGATLIQATHTSGYRGPEMDELLRKHCGFQVVGTLYRIHNV